jgi:hypothetical protein
VHALREDLGSDMDQEERHGPEGCGTMRRLDEDPVSGVQDHAVGGDQAERNRGAQRDQREDAGVEEHEVLGRRVDDVTSAGQRQERDGAYQAADREPVDLGNVLGSSAATGRAGVLTAAGTAARHCHGVTS